MVARCGTLKRYLEGCSCPSCRKANADERRRRRMRSRAASEANSRQSEPGEVEKAVMEELAKLTDPSPALVRVARSMAHVLDTPGAPSKPAAAKQLTDTLILLRDSQGAPAGKLSAVRKMTQAG